MSRRGSKPARRRARKSASHARRTVWASLREVLASRVLRRQNVGFFLIFAVFCFTFPPILRYIRSHQYFAVSEVVVVGAERLEESRVQRWVGLLEGRSIWSASPGSLEERLSRQPAIARAEVHRLLPDRIHIAIEEEPVRALLRSGTQFYLVSAAGEVLDATVRPSADLPIVSIDSQELPSRADLREALEVVGRFETGAGGISISEVEIQGGENTKRLVAHSANGRLTVRLGWGDWGGRLEALARVVADASGQKAGAGFLDTGRLAGTVDVIDPETVVARWRPSRGVV